MQRIERYGVMALALLLVTILAVALWGERADAFGPGAADERVARADDAAPPAREVSPPRGRQTRPSQPTSQPTGRRLNERTNRGPELSGAGGRPAALPVVDGAPRPPRTQRATAQASPRTEVDPPRRESPPERTSMRVAEASLADRGQPQRIRRSVDSADESRKATPAADRNRSRSGTESGSGDDYHRVRKGETLSGIAQARLGSSKRWRELADFNDISDPRKIAVGQKLALPGGRAADRSPAPRASSEGSRYTIRPGDTLSEIAQSQLGRSSRWKEIVELNPKVDPARLMVGTKLRMPGGALAALDGRELARAQ